MRRWAVGGVLAIVAALAPSAVAQETGAPAAPAAERAAPAVVILVRHAETAPDGTRDPALSKAGRERAVRLASMLSDVPLHAVYTTDYRRTRATAGGVAEAARLVPRVYDASRLEAFARTLAAGVAGGGGPVLVVGHSNTTPALVEALGGEPGRAIAEDEHDRLYVLYLDDAGVRTLLLRY